ncbi:uncharacterized protein METZ01_LOCUS85143 [marine metagenome]|uniref:Uncharacterized protein n=1 Tax=marine metagenome TaxID=408172 RepID=A0A381UVY5_9ZZZZ
MQTALEAYSKLQIISTLLIDTVSRLK